MKAYLITAAGTVFVAVIAGFIVPDGRLKKSIDFCVRLICIVILIQPVTKIFNFSPHTEKDGVNYEAVCSVISQTQSRAVQKLILENCGFDCECRVEIAFEGGEIREKGIFVSGNFENENSIGQIYEYLRGLGYININVNEETSRDAESK